jgi:hypothetical protein
MFYVDNALVMPLVSTALSWTTVTFNVTKGARGGRAMAADAGSSDDH